VKKACIAGLQASVSASANGAERVGAGGGGVRNRSCCYSRVSRTSGVKHQKGVWGGKTPRRCGVIFMWFFVLM
jgi:hypothetical protein